MEKRELEFSGIAFITRRGEASAAERHALTDISWRASSRGLPRPGLLKHVTPFIDPPFLVLFLFGILLVPGRQNVGF